MRTIYNTSFIVDEAIEQEWIGFIKEHYIAPVREHRLCRDTVFTKVSIDQPEGKTYSLQLVFDTPEQQEQFLANWLPGIEAEIIRNYTDRYVCFSSILTEI